MAVVRQKITLINELERCGRGVGAFLTSPAIAQASDKTSYRDGLQTGYCGVDP
jgi:hypothetical protein